jgi:predicted nuclease with TOPRIM domain
MSGLTDRTAYLRGLAEGMNLAKEKNENKLLLEMLSVLDEMAQKVSEIESDVEELDEYVESIDADLSDMEEAIFGDDEYGDDDEDMDEDEFDENEELSFDCPHCGNAMRLKASDIDFDQSPVCPKCGKPFFPDVIEGEDDEDEE